MEQRSTGDPHLRYLDGRLLYGEDDAVALPLPDRLHPDPATHRLIGDRFAALALHPGAELAEAGDERTRQDGAHAR